MIAMLRGTLFQKDLEGAIIDVSGVGYRVDMPLSSLHELPPVGEEITLHVHTSVREDAIDLYGFTSEADKKVFQKLTSVSGIGAKLGLNALSAFPATELVDAVITGNLVALKSVKGIGKKTAERVVLELRDTFTALDLGSSTLIPQGSGGRPSSSGSVASMLNDLRSGLTNLGFTPARIETTISDLRERATDMSEDDLFREALNILRQ